ncbi:MAG TPA: SpoIIE family protein phosphatase [Acetivibrio clariflavus]|nr:SpoIIE family protein phosphatase [Acetivibrio clariflavus]
MVVFDLNTKELIYCNAGFHKYPLLVRDDEKIVGLNKVGLPITTAIDTDLLKYEDHSLPLSAGMTLFMMSDGLPEQRVNNEFYENRLKELLTEVSCLKPAQIVQKVHKDFTDFFES